MFLRCPTKASVLDGATKVKVLVDDSCDQCSSQLVSVEFKPVSILIGFDARI